jgi:hypothetical protein
MRHADILAAYCLLGVLYGTGCTGQAFDSPITTKSGFAFMSSKHIQQDNLSVSDSPEKKLNKAGEESATEEATPMIDCPTNSMDLDQVKVNEI